MFLKSLMQELDRVLGWYPKNKFHTIITVKTQIYHLNIIKDLSLDWYFIVKFVLWIPSLVFVHVCNSTTGDELKSLLYVFTSPTMNDQNKDQHFYLLYKQHKI